jgi:sensor histidine kinase YesM
MKIKISAYWKCQLIGWNIVAFMLYFVNVVTNPQGSGFFIRAIVTAFFGIIFSHSLRLTIKVLGIFKKRFALQIIYLSLLSATWALLGTSFFLWALTISGIQKATNPQNPLTDEFFGFTIYAYYQISTITVTWTAIYFLVHYIREIRKVERDRTILTIRLLETEAKALRAQMNPHFIFNCMNSIKLLMQQNENDKAVNYLTTFSKLIRTIFQNSDKREITLYDEIETCKLYTQLESMRFADKFGYAFSIDETIDLKLLMVPALIIQPFIENAIWHGIMPKENGGCVNMTVKRTGENVFCIIDDDGIGRETSKLNKFKGDAHESRGVHLTQSRIDLDNLINQRNASLEIMDKKDENDKATGTTVILKFMEI